MMALEKHAATAAHWSVAQYETLFHAPSAGRVALVIQEETQPEESKIQGFVIARVVGAEWEIENIAIAGPARRRGLGTRLLGELLDMARAKGAGRYFWKSAHRTVRHGLSMRNGRSRKAGIARAITKIRKKTRFCITLYLSDLHHARCKVIH